MKWNSQTILLSLAVCLGFSINAAAGPNIVMQPANQRTYAGGNVIISVYSDDTNALSYQWFKGGNEIEGATNPRLVLRNVTSGDVDSYSVLVTDGVDTTVSSNATLTLYADGNVVGSSAFFSSDLESLRRIKAVAYGRNHGLALRYDGKLLTFGTPDSLQYQGPYNIYSYLPPGLTTASAIAVDDTSYGMALPTNGVPRVWSFEASRELPIPAEAHDVIDIAATSWLALALRADGTVVCWPFNTNTGGLLAESFVPDSVTNAVAISGNSGVASVLRRDGTVLEWTQSGMIQFTNDMTNVCKLAGGNVYSVAMLQDGEIVGWFHGGGYGGLLQTNVMVPLFEPPTNVAELVPNFAGVLTSEGSLVSLISFPPNVNTLIGLGPVQHVAGATAGYVMIRQMDTPVVYYLYMRSVVEGPLSLVQSVKLMPGQGRTILVNAAGRGPLSYQWFKNGKIVAGATSSGLRLRGITSESGSYTVQVKNRAGTATSHAATVTVEQPALTVSGLPGIQTTNDTVHYEGTYPIGNTLTIASYPSVRLPPPPPPFLGEPSEPSPAPYPPAPTLETNGSIVSWSVDIPLRAGTNTFGFWNVGPDEGASIMRTVYRVVKSNISVATTGVGIVRPILNGQELEVGKQYTVNAYAGAGFYFSGWSERSTNSVIVAGADLSSPTLTFTMVSNLVVTANFSSNQFPQLKGAYHGLFYSNDGIEQDTSGYIELQLAGSGTFTGRLIWGGARYRFSGSFIKVGTGLYSGSPGTNTAFYVQRPGKAPLYVSLTIMGSEINGLVTDNYSSSQITMDKSVYDPEQAARYTLVVQGVSDGISPYGYGYASVAVDASGRLTLVGSLADGTPISHSTGVSAFGKWPLYVPLYNGKGSIISWGNLTSTGSSDVLSWSRPADRKSRLFSQGFTNEVMVMGSRYYPQGNVFGITNASAVLDAGNSSWNLFNECAISANGVLSVDPSSGDHLRINVNRTTGTFSGSFVSPDNQQTVSVHGAILQYQKQTWGYFLRTNQSGTVSIQ